jgi:protein transport protein SEC13
MCPSKANLAHGVIVFAPTQRCGQATMSSAPVNFDSGHSGMVHDAQLDYYGRRLATCSSDSTIKLFDVVGEQHTHLADLTGHEGPVWQVAWAHPSFGSLLASCSFDHQVIVWKEVSDNQWVQVVGSLNRRIHPSPIAFTPNAHSVRTAQVYRSPANLHTASVNSIAWAPYETGLILACASSDGSFSIITYQKDGSWEATKRDNAHAMGCTAISWAPYTVLSATKSGAVIPKRLVTSGCDNLAKVAVCF